MQNQTYIYAFTDVRQRVMQSIEKVLESKRTIKPAHQKKLEEYTLTLSKTAFLDKNKLDEIMEEVQSTFDRLGLKEG